MLQIVLAQDQHRALGRQTPIQQTLTNAARGVQRLGKAHVLPVAAAAIGVFRPASEKGLVRALLGPVHQAVGEAIRVGGQLAVGTQVVHARRAVAECRAGDAEFQRAVLGNGHVCLRWLFLISLFDEERYAL